MNVELRKGWPRVASDLLAASLMSPTISSDWADAPEMTLQAIQSEEPDRHSASARNQRKWGEDDEQAQECHLGIVATPIKIGSDPLSKSSSARNSTRDARYQ